MESVVKIASYIADRYQKDFGHRISEMKLHKLLYFTQRESIIQKNEPMFPEEFLAWRYGPVMIPIRNLYSQGIFDSFPDASFIEENKKIFDVVFLEYANMDAWSLSRLSHGEFSWKNARKGYLPEQNSSTPISLEDIKKDADRIKLTAFMLNLIKEQQEPS